MESSNGGGSGEASRKLDYTGNIVKKQIDFSLKNINKHLENDAAFNYVNIIYGEEFFKQFQIILI